MNNRLVQASRNILVFSHHGEANYIMDFVSYNYFPTPKGMGLSSITDGLFSSKICLSHLGKKDPPKKWNGGKTEFLSVLTSGSDLTNYTFGRDHILKIEIDFQIHHDPKWVHSIISIGGVNRELVESLSLHFVKYINSFLCISSQMGHGKPKVFRNLFQSEECPKFLLDRIFS